MTYQEFYRRKSSLDDLLPSKWDIADDNVPLVVAAKAEELRLLILGAMADLDSEGYDDDE